MKRRDFLRYAGVASADVAWVFTSSAFGRTSPSSNRRTFEVTTHVEVLRPSGMTRAWLPLPLAVETRYQTLDENRIDTHGGIARRLTQPVDGLAMLVVEWAENVKPVVTVTSRVITRDYDTDLTRSETRGRRDDSAALGHFLRPTRLLPTDGVVGETAKKITAGAKTDVAKARAIYDWIVDNTFREPSVRGCGLGDIRFMLESGNLGGKCADLNALFVGLARAAQLPARDVYGIRVGPSRRGYKSLGTATNTITKAQHCRAEVYLTGHGWVPVDPADVRKVALEEPTGVRQIDDPVDRARTRLFGSWEMNWIAFNFAHDVVLPQSAHEPLPFFMYPQAETAAGRLDALDPDNFRYEIDALELKSPDAEASPA